MDDSESAFASRSRSERSPWQVVMQLLLMVVMFFLIRATVVEAYKIPSASMENSLLVGDFIITEKVSYGGEIPLLGVDIPGFREPKRGDVIVFKYPGDGQTAYIKRCVGLAEDTIEIVDKKLYINSEPFDPAPHPKFIDTTQAGTQRVLPRRYGHGSRDNFGPFEVPEGQYFMMGDNRDNSSDSRFWGPVTDDLIVGRAVLIHFSWDNNADPAPAVTLSDPLSLPRVFIHNTVHFFRKVRWERLLQPIA